MRSSKPKAAFSPDTAQGPRGSLPSPGASRTVRILLVLGTLVVVAIAGTGSWCKGADEVATDTTHRPPDPAPAAPEPSVTAPPDTQLAPQPSGTAAAGGPAVFAPGEREVVGAAHILIAYKGAQLAPKGVTRSKEDARKRAEEVLAKVKVDPTKLGELAAQYSDDGSKVTGGAIGNFERNAMPAEFADAAFGMSVGAVSGVVETPRGFHIIQRTR